MDKTQALKLPRRPGAAMPETFSDTDLKARVRALERFCEDIARVMALVNKHVPMAFTGGGFDFAQMLDTIIEDPASPEVPVWNDTRKAWMNRQLAAAEIEYTDTLGILSATNVQDAIDALAAYHVSLGTPAGWQFNAETNSGHAAMTWD